MHGPLALAILIPVAYFAGSIPFGLVVGLAKGIDPRTAGSGNIGATNLGRLLGGRYFALVFTLDLLKGLVPAAVASWLVHHAPAAQHTWQFCSLWLGVGLAAILGHLFSVFLKFHGGKGVATSAGVLLGIYPYLAWPALVGIAVWVILFLVKRYVSLASVFAAAAMPVAYTAIGLLCHWPIFGRQMPFLIFNVLVAALVVYKHRGNIQRLRAGTESRVVRSHS